MKKLTEVKLCKNCRWRKPDYSLGGEFAICMRPKKYSLVSGKLVSDNMYCTLERDDRFYMLGMCGEAARYFEKRKAWYIRLWNWMFDTNRKKKGDKQ